MANFKKGLLIITCLTKLNFSLANASKKVLNHLYIHYHPKDPLKFEILSRALSSIYTSSLELCGNIDVRVLISTMKNKASIISRLNNVDLILVDGEKSSSDRALSLMHENGNYSTCIDDREPKFNNVVLGGTFDRLHIGHKILLSEAALRAHERLVVGVTDVNMIATKKLPELVLPLETRLKDVREFLDDIDNTLNYEVVPIQDPFGPTATDSNLDLIVVSDETMKGGQKVNEIRRGKNFRELEIYSIPLVEIKEALIKEKESKISSSNQRMDILGTQFKEPYPRPNLPKYPYIIGLIGGIASGKSKMSERFKNMGAGVIDCDKLAHALYEPGEKCYKDIIDAFGKEVVGVDGKIDRKNLGAIVFSNKEQLQALNHIVWPNLLEKAKEKIKQLYEEEKRQIVILEAAILIQAGWEQECHEIWSCIIPPEVAVQRIMERNNLLETDAKARVASQVENSVVVSHSNVVFSSLWSYEYSQMQAEKAWNELLKRLEMAKI